jgi:chromosome segregation ATPase
MKEIAEQYVEKLVSKCIEDAESFPLWQSIAPISNELLTYMQKCHAQRTQLTLAQEMARENERLKQRVSELEELQLLDVHAICDQRDSYEAECDSLRRRVEEFERTIEGLRNNTPDCDACAELLWTGMTFHQHTCGIARPEVVITAIPNQNDGGTKI